MTLKVLALHGSQQNGEIMRTRLGRIVPKLKKIASFSYIDAPHSLPLKEGNDVRYLSIRKQLFPKSVVFILLLSSILLSYRTWYIRENGVVNLASLNESLSVLKIFWAKEGWICMKYFSSHLLTIQHPSISRNNASYYTSGPFDGVFGFSQGGAIGALLATKPNLFPGLKFVILSSAPDISELTNLSGVSAFAVSSTVKSLHFAGLADIVVPMSISRVLASRFESSQFLEHEQGHCIPTKPGMIAQMASFLESQLLSKGAADQSSLSSNGIFPDDHKLSGKSTVGKKALLGMKGKTTTEGRS